MEVLTDQHPEAPTQSLPRSLSAFVYIDTAGIASAMGDLVYAMPTERQIMAFHLSKIINWLLNQSSAHHAVPLTASHLGPSVPVTPADYLQGNAVAHRWSTASDEWGNGMAVNAEEGWFLYGLTRMIRPRLVVEIGTHRGFSTMFLAGAVRDNGFGRVLTLDIADHGQQARLAARGLTTPLVECLIQDELTYTPPQSVELLFHDGRHGFEAIRDSLAHWTPFLAAGAVVVVDDSRFEPQQHQAIVDWMAQAGARGCPLPTVSGLWCLKYGQSPKEAPRQYLIDDLLDNLIG